MAETSLDAFKVKDSRFMADWPKSKGLHKLCSVFEGIQEPFVLSLVSRGWRHLITWNGPIMGHLNSFSIFQKLFKNSNARGVALGGCLSFDLTGTLNFST